MWPFDVGVDFRIIESSGGSSQFSSAVKHKLHVYTQFKNLNQSPNLLTNIFFEKSN